MTQKLDTGIRQEQIAQAALAVVARHGLAGLNVAAIAKLVGIVPSAIYRHFGGKDEVVEAVLGMVRERLLDNVRNVCAETSDPYERLHRLLERHLALIRANHALPRLVFSDEIYNGPPARRRMMFRTVRAYLDKVAGIVREGQEAGVVRADIEPATAAVMFLGLAQPAAILWHISSGTFDVVAHAEEAWRLFSETLRGA
ncbi:MAG: TetR/AcrR family transcriptional regulator [Vicinamibacteraceae bacterium]|nr:TetR/AcrR family transcriptional regulator [Vicinamibacteraceae bacterium]